MILLKGHGHCERPDRCRRRCAEQAFAEAEVQRVVDWRGCGSGDFLHCESVVERSDGDSDDDNRNAPSVIEVDVT